MRDYCFMGDDVNLGRFGPVRRGDRLLLTDTEQHAIESDRRFEEWDDKKHGKIQKAPVSPPATATEEEKQAARKAAEEEESRKANLAKANNEWNVMKTELEQSSYDQLLGFAKAMNEENESDIKWSGKTSKSELIRLIIEAKKRLRESKPKE